MPLPSDQAFGEIVGGFYRAVAEPASWFDATAALVKAFDGSSGGILLVDPAGRPDLLCMPGTSVPSQRLYGEYFQSRDPWADICRKNLDRVVLGQDFISAEDYAGSEFWNDFARPHTGAFHMVGAHLQISDGVLAGVGMTRLRDQRPFEEAERRSLARLLPHLLAALRLRQTFVSEVETRALGAVVLDALDIGIVVARGDGAPVFVNAAALASGALQFGPAHRPVAGVDPAAARRLLALIRDACTGGAGGAVVLVDPTGPDQAALVTGLPPGLGLPGGTRDLALVVLRSLEAGRPAIAETLRQLFGLTLAEAELTLALLAGERPDAIAEARGVRISTVRSQLRAILDKTGTRRQSDLIRLLARLAPFRESDPSG